MLRKHAATIVHAICWSIYWAITAAALCIVIWAVRFWCGA